jgi:uncharacterized protein (TIGR03435 family)
MIRSSTFRINAATLTVCIAILSASRAWPQTSASRPEFEVATVKPGSAGSPSRFRALPGGRLTVENTSLQLLIENAYSLKIFQILPAPAWIQSDRWDVAAKAEGNATAKEMMLMLQTFLEARFKLTLHRETKVLPVYILSAAKNGLKLPNAREVACEAPDPTRPSSASQPPAANQPAPTPCGRLAQLLTIIGERRMGKLKGKSVNMAELVRVLEAMMARPVVDKTGFKGTFDVDVDYAPDPHAVPDEIEVHPAPDNEPGRSVQSLDPAGASIFGVLQQLGLRLESTKGPVEMLVIDHVEKPDQN